MKHYIFTATGNDTEQNGKERTEYRHEVLSDREEAFRSAARLWRSLISAGWNNVDIEIKEVTETVTIAPTKRRNNMTPDQKRIALAHACSIIPDSACSKAENCPVCGVCTYFADTSDKMACDLYAEAVRRGAIKEEQ